jgi:hypothetical protein
MSWFELMRNRRGIQRPFIHFLMKAESVDDLILVRLRRCLHRNELFRFKSHTRSIAL